MPFDIAALDKALRAVGIKPAPFTGNLAAIKDLRAQRLMDNLRRALGDDGRFKIDTVEGVEVTTASDMIRRSFSIPPKVVALYAINKDKSVQLSFVADNSKVDYEQGKVETITLRIGQTDIAQTLLVCFKNQSSGWTAHTISLSNGRGDIPLTEQMQFSLPFFNPSRTLARRALPLVRHALEKMLENT